MYFTTSRKALQ